MYVVCIAFRNLLFVYKQEEEEAITFSILFYFQKIPSLENK